MIKNIIKIDVDLFLVGVNKLKLSWLNLLNCLN